MGTIAIVSGGMDSVTLLHFLHSQDFKLKALSFDYGQRHKKELEFARENCEALKVPHTVVDLSSITPLISNSSLTGDQAVPDGHYADESMKQTVVPNRNMIMLSVAIGAAENLGFTSVAIGSHAGDHPIYLDCRTEFIEALSQASDIGTYNHVKIYAPFSDISKTDICALGNLLEVDYTKTWSCYRGGKEQCGRCGTCCERLESLSEAKNVDALAVFHKLVKRVPEFTTWQ